MRLHTVTKSLAAASANNIALSQSLAAAGALTLNGAAVSGGVATLDSQRRIILTSGGDDTGITWTIIGTNQDGSAIKDSFAGASGAAAQSNLDFLTVTSITASGATASTVTAGTNTVGSSPWQLMNDTTAGTPNLGIGIQITGTANVTFEYCHQDFLADPSQPQSAIANAQASPNPAVWPYGPLQAITASADGALDFQVRGYRITINSGTGAVKMTTQQAGLSSP